jgi:flagellar hook protein FlgE
MDVEGNNIANVNTTGYKYSRTNFEDSLLQTMKPATSPQGQLGGRNALQVGSGVGVASVQRIHSQGSTQSTDNNTDMAINGNGFFVVSDDGGKTYNYTRAGNFSLDALGNLVNPNGLIVQGWKADSNFEIDSTMGIKNIQIDPGMTVPAKASSEITINANLNAGISVQEHERSPVRSTVNLSDDLGSLYNYQGDPLRMNKNEDTLTLELTRRYDNNGTVTEEVATHTFTYGDTETTGDGRFTTMQDLLNEINHQLKDSTGTYENRVVLTGDGQIAGARHITDIIESPTSNAVLEDILEPVTFGSFISRSFKTDVNGSIGSDIVGEMFNSSGEAIMLETGQGTAFSVSNLGETRKFVYREPNPDNANSYFSNNFQDDADIQTATNDQGFRWMRDANGDKAFMTTGEQISFTFNPDAAGGPTETINVDPITLTYGTGGANSFQSIQDLIEQVNITLQNSDSDIRIGWDEETGQIVDEHGVIGGVALADADGNAPAAGTALERLQNHFLTLAGADGVASTTGEFKKNDTYYFTNTQELVNLHQKALDDAGDELNHVTPLRAEASIDDEGRITIKNQGSVNFDVSSTGYSADQKAAGADEGNKRFTKAMSLNATVAAGSQTNGDKMYAATWRTGVEVYDSSGSRHQLTFNFRKESTSQDNSEPTVWKWNVDAPEPTSFEYPTSGEIRFNLDGSVQSYSPPAITLNPNTGSSSGQVVRLDFGEGGAFHGLTSFAEESNTRFRDADGYAGGFLEDITTDQTGTLLGVFSNGQNFKLAQVALATFANDEGLESQGGNLYSRSSNSGGPTIGTAGTASRGEIAPSNLEMSNVDLSRSLTNLIIVQRGYQASSKTITTSDQLLNTLLQLKQ